MKTLHCQHHSLPAKYMHIDIAYEVGDRIVAYAKCHIFSYNCWMPLRAEYVQLIIYHSKYQRLLLITNYDYKRAI